MKAVRTAVLVPFSLVLETKKNTLNYTQFLKGMQATAGETRAVKVNAFRTVMLHKRPDGSLLEDGVYTFSRTAVDPDGDFRAKDLTHNTEFQATYFV